MMMMRQAGDKMRQRQTSNDVRDEEKKKMKMMKMIEKKKINHEIE